MSKRKFRFLKIFFKILIIIVSIILLYFIVIIAINSKKDYSPAISEDLEVKKGRNAWFFSDKSISIISWNIGYSALGKHEDFFYEGGKKMRPDKEQYKEYLKSIFNELGKMDTVDFVLLQEVDINSKRSFYTRQDSSLAGALPTFSHVTAINYNVPFVPFPLFNPTAKVHSGMMSFSRYIPEYAKRISFPFGYAWPMKVFFLDRCFIIEKFNLDNHKSLYIINTHNSAFDDAGDIRIAEMIFLRSYLLNFYENGDYVVVGGDWNQNPLGFDKTKINTGDYVREIEPAIENDYLPKGWKWYYDPKTPTNRDVNTKYEKGVTTTTVLDYFLCSPNITVNEVRTINKHFENSDHNPVYLNFSLQPDTACCDSLKIYEKVKEIKSKEKGKKKR